MLAKVLEGLLLLWVQPVAFHHADGSASAPAALWNFSPTAIESLPCHTHTHTQVLRGFTTTFWNCCPLMA